MEKLQKGNFKLNPQKNGLSQTDRNALKKESIAFLLEKLESVFVDSDVYLVAEGIAVATYNEAMEQTITFIVDTTFKNFDYNALVESEQYEQQQQDKLVEKERKEKAKQLKITQDKKLREQKKIQKLQDEQSE
jgi:hypothetical protein